MLGVAYRKRSVACARPRAATQGAEYGSYNMGQATAPAKRKRPSTQALDLPEGLTGDDLLDIYATMALVRTLDERVWMLNRQGKAAIVASSQGHEARPAPLAPASER